MKQFLFLVVLNAWSMMAFAQPSNDNCNQAIDLGAAPKCDNTFFDNISATTSDIGVNNIPTCFNGGTVQRDVWFSFTTDATITDYRISVTGVSDGVSTALSMPQIALYRGDCNSLDELFCGSAPVGISLVEIEALGLLNSTQYFVRINDYSTSATPNAGTFQVCIEEFTPDINIGSVAEINSCSGTLFDSGGPANDYASAENLSTKICPDDPHGCIELSLIQFDIEEDADFLRVYDGETNSAPLLAVATGVSSGSDFKIQGSANCVLVEFISDGFVTSSGFELRWNCTVANCDASSLDGITFIPSLPFSSSGASTCDFASTFASGAACPTASFLGGPEKIFRYISGGRECITIQLSNANPESGIVVLNAPPNDPNAFCIASSSEGRIASANLQNPGTYYIVVANALGCTDFDIFIEATDCNLSPALLNALCNPINNCATADENGAALPTVLFFEDGFQDIAINQDQNNGCWDLTIGLGLNDPNFYWFSFQALDGGNFGFILQSADVPSDLDFNVWGPFSNDQVCGNPNDVVNFILNNQPIRSSYAGGTEPTGLVSTHPSTGEAVTDNFDCDPRPGPGGDDFSTIIQAQAGEVYVVLLNDWQDNIQDDGILVDWSPTTPGVLVPPSPEIIKGDTAICLGGSAQLEVASELTSIIWTPSNTLSCSTCLNPVATPTETTTYQAIINGACNQDTLNITVEVFSVDAGPDVTTCLNDQFQIVAGSDFTNATYSWISTGSLLSCTDCPNPVVTADADGVFMITVTLTSDECVLQDQMELFVNPNPAPQYEISDDIEICQGDRVELGGTAQPAVVYSWTSDPPGFSAAQPNPAVTPTESTTYLLIADNGICPFPAMDSVVVEVTSPPVIMLANDTSICEGESIILGNTIPQSDVTYSWTPTTGLEQTDIPNPIATPTAAVTGYALLATRGACEIRRRMNVDVTEIFSSFNNPDTVFLCLGDTAQLELSIRPNNIIPVWTPASDNFTQLSPVSALAYPTDNITYYGTLTNGNCVQTDSVFIKVDSLPADLTIFPKDTTICDGSIVILKSPIYDPVYYPDIMFEWQGIGMLSGDSLYNLVVQPPDTTIFSRATSNGACNDTTTALVNVKPIETIEVTPEDPVLCAGESVGLMAINPNVEEFEWMPMAGLSCADCPNPTAAPPFTTQYMVTGTVDGCPAQGSVTVEVINTPQVGSVSGSICLGETIALNSAPDPTITYTWSANPPDPTLDVNAPVPVVTPTQTTTYSVMLDNGACDPVSTSFTVEVIGDQTLEVSEEQSICNGESITLNATGSTAGSYRWINASNGESVGDGPNITVSPSTNTDYEVIYTYGNNCGVLTGSVNVNVEDLQANVSASAEVLSLGQSFEASAAVSPSSSTVVWLGPNGNEVANGLNVGITPQTEGQLTFVAMITSPAGCELMIPILVTVIKPDLEIPNAFTPDGDGINDVFKLVPTVGDVQIKIFQVFDRWGEMVFETSDVNEGWDGTHNGKNMPSDVYVYLVILDTPAGDDIRKGDVTLIR